MKWTYRNEDEEEEGRYFFWAASAALARASSEANLSSSLVIRLLPPSKQPKHSPIFLSLPLFSLSLFLFLFLFLFFFSITCLAFTPLATTCIFLLFLKIKLTSPFSLEFIFPYFYCGWEWWRVTCYINININNYLTTKKRLRELHVLWKSVVPLRVKSVSCCPLVRGLIN